MKKYEKWNATPLLGHFRGRIGICSFYIEPSFAFSAPLSLYFLLNSLSLLFPLAGQNIQQLITVDLSQGIKTAQNKIPNLKHSEQYGSSL